jgi:hypothetical protein
MSSKSGNSNCNLPSCIHDTFSSVHQESFLSEHIHRMLYCLEAIYHDTTTKVLDKFSLLPDHPWKTNRRVQRPQIEALLFHNN